ncbi:MAG: acyl carrier protein [Gammaproteobacteria bacterium]|nr:acyl carrier protein [Gammaproteobacteria bacterium]
MLLNDDQIYAQLKTILMDSFEIEESQISPQANLFQDLDLDSIDGVDLAIKLQELTGKRIKPEEFKSVRTVGDVIVTVQRLMTS